MKDPKPYAVTVHENGYLITFILAYIDFD